MASAHSDGTTETAGSNDGGDHGPKGARGKRFEGALDAEAAALNASVSFDHRLLAHDVDGSIAHARMLGKNTLWLPGTDHAGIATQVVVERLLKRA